MIDKTTSAAQRALDCVTEVRKGNTVLTVSGFFKLNATDTAADKMAKFIASSAALEGRSRGASADCIDTMSTSA